MHVALAAPAALGEDLRFIGGEVCHDASRCGFPHHCATRNTDHQIRRTLSRTIPCTAIFATLCNIFPFEAEINQCGKIVVHLKNDISASAAVSAVRSSGSNIFFPVK